MSSHCKGARFPVRQNEDISGHQHRIFARWAAAGVLSWLLFAKGDRLQTDGILLLILKCDFCYFFLSLNKFNWITGLKFSGAFTLYFIAATANGRSFVRILSANRVHPELVAIN